MADEDTGAEAPEAAPDPGAQIKATALGEMAKSESIEAYAAERADQDAEAAGKQPSTPPEERVNRYQAALEQARQATDQARQETGLNGEQNGFDAQVEQAALAQEQDRAYEEEITRREKQAADVALYTHKANQELDQHPDFWDRVKATFTAIPPTTEIAQQLLECENGPEIVWRMTQHPDAISELNAMSPKQAERIIAKLDGAIMAERHAARQFASGASVRRTTSAPPPIRPPRGGGAQPPQDLHQLASRGENVGDYIKARQAMEKSRD
jgi:hypothetical protein